MSKISELTDGGSLLPTDTLIAVRSGANVKVVNDTINVTTLNPDQINMGDNEQIRLGNSQDLLIYHDGTNSIINDAGTGSLQLQQGGSTKLEVTTTGVDVTGTVTADGLDVSTSAENVATFASTDTAARIVITDGTDTGYVNVSSGKVSLGQALGLSGNNLNIDASGNVGIGVTSSASNYSRVLHLHNTSTGSALHLTDGTSGSGANDGTDLLHYGTDTYITNRETTGNTRFFNGGSEAMRINSSGNLLVGKTATNIASDGVQLFNDGFVHMTADISSGSQVLTVNRKTSDGDLAVFRKDGTTVGSIGTSSGNLYIEKESNSGLQFGGSGQIIPRNSGAISNNTVDLGSPSYRFKNLYLSGGAYLGGTGSANLLDDYEEGTWTPTVVGQTTAGTYTLTDDGSTYTKVGRKVTVIAKIRDITEVSAGVGNLNIGGLPFAVSEPGQGSLRFNTLDVAADTVGLIIENLGTGSKAFISESKDNASGSATGISAITSGTTDIFFTLTYFV